MPDSASEESFIVLASTPSQVLAGCSTRFGGISSDNYATNNLALHVHDDPQRVQRNRDALQTRLGAEHIQWLTQVHGIRCLQASKATAQQAPAADAMWTTQRGLALAIMTADCVPVVVWDRNQTLVAAIHAGWRGLVDNVIDSLLAQLPVAVGQLNAWIGPCIGVAHYEVGQEVWHHFSDLGEGVLEPPGPHNHDEEGKRMLNLAVIAQTLLHRAGVQQVSMSGWCSYADARFYSHRRAAGQATGRMASVVMLR